MSFYLPERCLRGYKTCKPLSQVDSDEKTRSGYPVTFICVGDNGGHKTKCNHIDRYTMCWRSKYTNERNYYDKRDLTHQLYVIAEALAIIEELDAK